MGCADELCNQDSMTPGLEIGLADAKRVPFTPIREADHAIMAPGSQGGYHLFLQVRAQEWCAEDTEMTYQVVTRDTQQIVTEGSGPLRLTKDVHPGAMVSETSTIVQLCPTPERMVDRAVSLTVSISNRVTTVHRTKSIVVRCPRGHEGIYETCLDVCQPRP